MTQRTNRTRRGAALLGALALLLLAGMIATSLLLASANSARLAARRRDSLIAFSAAEGGLKHGLARLSDSDSYSGQSGLKIGDALVSVSIDDTNDPTIKRITSTATVTTVGGAPVARTVEGLAQVTDLPPMWGYAMFSEKKLDLKKKVLIDSAPRKLEGNVYVDAEVKAAKKGVEIDGDLSFIEKVKKHKKTVVSPLPNPKKDPLRGVVVTGTIDRHAANTPIPTVSKTFLMQEATANGYFEGNIHIHNDDIDVDPRGPAPKDKDQDWSPGDPPYVLRGFIKGNVDIDGKIPVQVDGVVYVTGHVHLGGSKIFGDGAVIAGKDMKFKKNSDMSFLDGQKVAFVCLSKKGIEVSKGSKIGGGLFAPYGKIKLDKNVIVFGSMSAKSFKMKGKDHVTRNTGFQPPTLGRYTSLLDWQEK